MRLPRFFLTVLFLVSPFAGGAQSNHRSATVIAERANVRAEPSGEASILSALNKGTVVAVIETRDAWTKISSNGKIGWMRASTLSPVNSVDVASVPAPIRAPEPSTRSPDPMPKAQASAPEPVYGYKDPGTATLIGVLVTGGGQFYSGETGKGAVLLGVGMGGLFLAIGSATASCNYQNCSSGTGTAIGLLAYLGSWGYGIMDAGNAARRHNAALGLHTAAAMPTIQSFADGRFGFGIAVGRGSTTK